MRQSCGPSPACPWYCSTYRLINSSLSIFLQRENTHNSKTQMATLSFTHLLSLSLIKTPKKTSPPRFLFQSLNPKIPSTSTTFINSKPRLSNASSLSIELNPQKTASTLREICEGHVPEHILRRQWICAKNKLCTIKFKYWKCFFDCYRQHCNFMLLL